MVVIHEPKSLRNQWRLSPTTSRSRPIHSLQNASFNKKNFQKEAKESTGEEDREPQKRDCEMDRTNATAESRSARTEQFSLYLWSFPSFSSAARRSSLWRSGSVTESHSSPKVSPLDSLSTPTATVAGAAIGSGADAWFWGHSVWVSPRHHSMQKQEIETSSWASM